MEDQSASLGDCETVVLRGSQKNSDEYYFYHEGSNTWGDFSTMGRD